MAKKEINYLVEAPSPFDGRDIVGTFTVNSWKTYIKELNEDRVADGCEEDELYEESMEENEDFIFTEIEVYN